ncbi:replicative DNA helicase [Lachnospiraceae bacterium XPB1003]|nr:replicative DNA helicase [Lachnospiraceae bacterium XPB1003]
MADQNTSGAVRVKPHDSNAEQAVIGGIYLDNTIIKYVEDILTDGKPFYNRAYGAVYDAMLALAHKGMAIDMLTLQDKLKEMDVPPEVVNPEFLRDALMAVPAVTNVPDYARIVQEKATLRELITVTSKIQDECYESKEDVTDLLTRSEKEITDIVQSRTTDSIAPIGEIVMEAMERINLAYKTTGNVTGLATGFTDLDNMTAGFQEGNLVIIAARPAMGKTSLVLSMTKNIAINQHKPVLFFSLEMSGTELSNRLLAMDSHVDSKKFKTGELSDAEWEVLVQSSGSVANANLILADNVSGLGDIRSIARRMKTERDIQLIIIDYLQLVRAEGKRIASKEQEVSEISRSLKLLAKELRIPIIALSQLSRAVEGRSKNDRRPVLSDLRESGAIEQDADTVMFIYRDEVYNEDTDQKNKAEIIIAKQRSGPIGTVNLAWLPNYTQFANLQR